MNTDRNDRDSKKAHAADATRRRPGQVQAFARVMARVTAPALKKRGLTQAELLIDWPQIVGPYFAKHTAPVRLTYQRGRGDAGILHLAVSPALATALQHEAPRLIERINTHAGHKAVERLKLVAAALAVAPQRKRSILPPPVAAQPPQAVAAVEEGPLRDALRRLARHFPEMP